MVLELAEMVFDYTMHVCFVKLLRSGQRPLHEETLLTDELQSQTTERGRQAPMAPYLHEQQCVKGLKELQ
jgi:hypothetical protein